LRYWYFSQASGLRHWKTGEAWLRPYWKLEAGSWKLKAGS